MLIESQFYEGGRLGSADLIPNDPAKVADRKRLVRTGLSGRNRSHAAKFRSVLTDWYGQDRAEKVQYAEAFEICEYGRKPTNEELQKLFPFFAE